MGVSADVGVADYSGMGVMALARDGALQGIVADRI
jgi:hypothetical protein